MKTKFKNLHLGLSAVVVIVAGLLYGLVPERTLPYFFDFKVDELELQNIFRAIMGLYFGFAIYWIIGIRKSKYWEAATLSNVIFMGGLATGRLVSTIVDGVSLQWLIGLLLEFFMMAWGIYNLRMANKKD